MVSNICFWEQQMGFKDFYYLNYQISDLNGEHIIKGISLSKLKFLIPKEMKLKQII